MAKLIYVCKRVSVDIDLEVSFICTRVLCSTEEDWEKLGRLSHYLQSMLDLPRVIRGNGLDMLQT